MASRELGPEPLWILGHNTNSIEEVIAALDQGANAVEIDVTAYAHDLNALCIDHAGIMGDDPGRASAPAFEPFLRELREVADRRPELCMVELDLKPPASRPDFGPVLMGAIREVLTRDTTLSLILSVADVTTSHPDLGTLRSITVQSDTSHIAAGWHLDSIVVESRLARVGCRRVQVCAGRGHRASCGDDEHGEWSGHVAKTVGRAIC